MIHDVIIIGSGPAGFTAALYAARADLNPVMFSGYQPGGQLMITTDVENYPGFPEGILGPELMGHFRKQVERFGTVIHDEDVTAVDFSKRPFMIQAAGEDHYAKSIIISTGASAKWLGLPSEVTFGGYGVSACATCDGFFFRNKDVIVVGGGDTALEEATYLTRHCRKVTLIHRRTEFRASKIMQDRAMCNPKIEILWNTALAEILGTLEPQKRVTGVLLRDTITQETRELPMDGVFIAIGHQPNSGLFKNVLDMDEVGYLIAQPGTTKTNIPGVFAAGDVADKVYRQAVTAAGSGCMAALDAQNYLAEETD